MAKKANRASTKKGPASILVFGEDINDARAIAQLIEALCPAARGRVKPRPKPTSLIRSASDRKVRRWIENLADASRNDRSPVACVFVHRDSDQPDDLAVLAADTEAALSKAGLEHGHAVVPVHKTEAWWLLFPDATETHRASWKNTLRKRPGNVDNIPDPKSELIERTRRGNERHAYSEGDSPDVARSVATALKGGATAAGVSPSFERFVESVRKCCESGRL